MAAPFADRPYTTDRDTARQSHKGTALHPRLMVLGSTWVRQDYAGGPMEVVGNDGAVLLLLPDSREESPVERMARLGRAAYERNR